MIQNFISAFKEELSKTYPLVTVTHERMCLSEFLVVKILAYSREIDLSEYRKMPSYVKQEDVIKRMVEIIHEEMKSKTELNTFGRAIEKAFEGDMIARKSWVEGTFVFAQVPSEINGSIVPNMTSLPPKVKDEFVKRGKNLFYSDQFAIVHPDNKIHGWSPTPSDCLATDWVSL